MREAVLLNGPLGAMVIVIAGAIAVGGTIFAGLALLIQLDLLFQWAFGRSYGAQIPTAEIYSVFMAAFLSLIMTGFGIWNTMLVMKWRSFLHRHWRRYLFNSGIAVLSFLALVAARYAV